MLRGEGVFFLSVAVSLCFYYGLHQPEMIILKRTVIMSVRLKILQKRIYIPTDHYSRTHHLFPPVYLTHVSGDFPVSGAHSWSAAPINTLVLNM